MTQFFRDVSKKKRSQNSFAEQWILKDIYRVILREKTTLWNFCNYCNERMIIVWIFGYTFYTLPKFLRGNRASRSGTVAMKASLESCRVIDLLFRQFTLPLVRFLASKEIQGWNRGLDTGGIFDRGSWSWPMTRVARDQGKGIGI